MFLQAPAISRIQWHPFTISSAPDEKTVTVHIKTLDEGSWTLSLMKYFQQVLECWLRFVQFLHVCAQMGPRQAFFRLDRQGAQGKLPGKVRNSRLLV